MPKANGYSCLQVWVDTFTGWIEAFPCRSEQAKEVIKILIHEIIPRFGLPRSLQSDNGSAFKAAVTQGVSKALGMEYHLHCSWRPQSSGKVEKANDIIKRHLRKLTQETQDKWIKVLPIALMRARTTPQKEGLSPFECIYGRPFLCTDIVIDPEALELTNYVTQLSVFQ
jgi:transposase InsO family protein